MSKTSQRLETAYALGKKPRKKTKTKKKIHMEKEPNCTANGSEDGEIIDKSIRYKG